MTGAIQDFGSAPLKAILQMWDAAAEHWDLDEEERSLLLGGFAPGAVADPLTYDHARAERRMRLCVELAAVLDRTHAHRRRTRFWLRAPNRYLGGDSPLDLMATSTAWIRWLADHVGLAS